MNACHSAERSRVNECMYAWKRETERMNVWKDQEWMDACIVCKKTIKYEWVNSCQRPERSRVNECMYAWKRVTVKEWMQEKIKSKWLHVLYA